MTRACAMACSHLPSVILRSPTRLKFSTSSRRWELTRWIWVCLGQVRDPETIKRLYSTAINCGARAICICDTAGHATPMGTFALVRFIIEEVVKPSGQPIRVDWHGHCDRGLAIANSMAALVAGAVCVHACALGIGERVGNTQMDQMLVNLKLMAIPPWADQDLTKIKQYCQA